MAGSPDDDSTARITNDEPIREREVIAAELRAVCARRARLGFERPSGRDDPWDAALFGLCLSGGGIRSATFNLGVLQALAKYRLLRSVDYLSTVSGGGYIGAWLTALIRRRLVAAQSPSKGGAQPQSLDIDAFERELAWSGGDGVNEHRELAAIRKLRAHSNYLTPKLGVLSGDFWALIAIYVRNALLNQLVLLFALAAVLLGPRLISEALRLLENLDPSGWFATRLDGSWLAASGELAAAAGTVALAFIGIRQLGKELADVVPDEAGKTPSAPATKADEPAAPDSAGPNKTARIVWQLVAPRLAIGLLGALWLPELADWTGNGLRAWLGAAVVGGAVNAIVWSLASRSGGPQRSAESFWQAMTGKAAFAAGALVLGPLALAGALWLAEVDYMGYRIIVAPPMVVGALLLSSIVHVGLAGNGVPSMHREWLSRLAGINGIVAIAWIALNSLVFLSPLLIDLLPAYLDIPLIAGWIASTAGGVYLARKNARATFVKRIVMTLAPWVFIAGMMILASAGLQGVLHASAAGLHGQSYVAAIRLDRDPNAAHEAYSLALDELKESLTDPPSADESSTQSSGPPAAMPWGLYAAWLASTEGLAPVTGVLLVALLFVWIFSRRVNINSFSLHNLYGNRIVRAFLGATVENRSGNPFTDFSSKDDLTLFARPGAGKCFVHRDEPHTVTSEADPGSLAEADQRAGSWNDAAYPGPYPIINTAINLVSSKNLAWQERKAGSFILSPLFCGFSESGTDPDSGAYRWTYAFSSDPKPLSLGEAVAVSGAAASPNMGYHTTAALAFLMGVFNIRLGRWVGNPRLVERAGSGMFREAGRRAFSLGEQKWRNTGPKFALIHLLREVLGMTDESRSYVYLSDGGHFENLGLYEMVRRRCRYIVVCDSGADPDYDFVDLGNAIRKCRIDFGVEIELDPREVARLDDDRCNAAPCAVGKIRYAPNRIGTLLYIKASRRRGMPSDVMQYALRNAAFPHESTGDQFFSESQFESYRRLGYFLTKQIFDAALDELEWPAEAVAPAGESQRKSDDERTDRGQADRDRATRLDPPEVDLAQLFARLEQNWYPASEHVSAHFSQLTTQIDALFERLRSSRELGFLNKQFYPEWQTLLDKNATHAPAMQDEEMWTLPSKPEELRQGFYFCNSLIQLMENAYIDLNLESEWKYPDNSGWMNVFRHWTWSSMFQVTWAISAATYGRRFRAFCRQRLELGVGEVMATPTYTGAPEDLGQTLERAGFNAVEIGQIDTLLELALPRQHIDANRGEIEIYRLDLRVQRRSGQIPLRTFSFGYALLAGPTLLMFRVQDHVRNMELGRKGLEALVDAHRRGSGGRGRIELPGATEALDALLRAIGEDPEPRHIEEFRAALLTIR